MFTSRGTQRDRSVSARVARVAVFLLRAAVVALVAFHLRLLVDQVAAGRLFEPTTAVRWFAAALIIAGFVDLRRIGVPLLRGRRAVVLWLLVVLLHVHAGGAPARVDQLAAAVPEAVRTVAAPIALASVLSATALLLFVLVVGPRNHTPSARCLAVAGIPVAGGLRFGYLPQFSVRPPPSDHR